LRHVRQLHDDAIARPNAEPRELIREALRALAELAVREAAIAGDERDYVAEARDRSVEHLADRLVAPHSRRPIMLHERRRPGCTPFEHGLTGRDGSFAPRARRG